MEIVEKEVNEEVAGDATQPKKMSYEEVIDIANQLQQQNSELRQKLMAMMQDQSILRLNFLMDIITNREAFPTKLVDKCKKEIEDGLFPSTEEQE